MVVYGPFNPSIKYADEQVFYCLSAWGASYKIPVRKVYFMGCWAPIFWYFFVDKKVHKPGKRGCAKTVWPNLAALTGIEKGRGGSPLDSFFFF